MITHTRLLHCLAWTGLVGLATITAHAAETVPFPQKAALNYSGPYGVSATMNFSRSSSNYSINTLFKIPMYNMNFSSQGLLKGTQLQPLRYTDTRKGKTYAQARFDYGNKKITYGKGGEPTQTAAMTGIPLDLFSLAWQLAISDGKLGGVSQFTNGKKVYNERTHISAQGERDFDYGGKKIKVKMFRAVRQGDVLEYALAPSLGNVPALIKYQDDGKSYQLKLTAATLDGKKY